jgi:lactoylglutathione lyase
LTLKIDHIALWTGDLERLKDFYIQYFQATPGRKYHNLETGFQSYFLSFASGTRLEIMRMPTVSGESRDERQHSLGYAHISVSVGSKEQVEALTSRLRQDGYVVLDGPRLTGDGYYESQVADPDGNRVEITI